MHWKSLFLKAMRREVVTVAAMLRSSAPSILGPGILQSRAHQSKHLETARMCLFGVWIHFVDLRREEYTDNSCIPSEQTFRTPEEDVYRRDLTINSLGVSYLDTAWNLIQLIGASTFTARERRKSLYAALFLPLCLTEK